jgi:hypothetical protein
VIDILDTLDVDFVEISGGNYEQPKMMDQEGLEPVFDQPVSASTRAREAYFLKYASAVQERAKMPLMVTGGFRTVAAMNEALAVGEADLIGLGRPLCVDTAAPGRLLAGGQDTLDQWEKVLRIGPGLLGPHSPLKLVKALNGFGAMSWYYEQLKKLGAGGEPDEKLGVLSAFLANQKAQKAAAGAWRAEAP